MSTIVIPQDLELERGVIGGMMLWGGETIRTAGALISPNDFSDEQLQGFFRVLTDMAAQGSEVDTHSLTRAIEAHNRRAGRRLNFSIAQECSEYAAANSKAANFEVFCKALRELSRRRAIQSLVLDAARKVADPANYADPLLAEIRNGIEEIASTGISPRDVIGARELAIREADERIRLYDEHGLAHLRGATTGTPWLDQASGGYQPGDLNIIAARPNTSKTRYTIWSLAACSKAGAHVGFISLDMSKPRLVKYLIPQLANINGAGASMRDVYDPDGWGEMERARLRDVCASVDPDGRFFVVPEPRGTGLVSIESHIREMAFKRGVKVVAIDQLQNIDGWERGASDRANYSIIVKGLKSMARYYGVSILALHQIQRAGATAPTMANLKDTGCLEEYSDSVLILHDPQKATIEAHGAFVEDGGKIRAPKESDDRTLWIKNVEPTRPLRLGLEKNRNDSPGREFIRFDFARGMAV